MEDQKKIEFYRYLKELFPNLTDTTIDNNEYNWSINIEKHGRLY